VNQVKVTYKQISKADSILREELFKPLQKAMKADFRFQ